jgi:hypothetical protein
MIDPYECNDLSECRELAFYWMQMAFRYKAEKKVFMDILLENNINPSFEEIIRRLNQIAFEDKK